MDERVHHHSGTVQKLPYCAGFLHRHDQIIIQFVISLYVKRKGCVELTDLHLPALSGRLQGTIVVQDLIDGLLKELRSLVCPYALWQEKKVNIVINTLKSTVVDQFHALFRVFLIIPMRRLNTNF